MKPSRSIASRARSAMRVAAATSTAGITTTIPRRPDGRAGPKDFLSDELHNVDTKSVTSPRECPRLAWRIDAGRIAIRSKRPCSAILIVPCFYRTLNLPLFKENLPTTRSISLLAAFRRPGTRQYGLAGRIQRDADVVREASRVFRCDACSTPWLARSVGFAGDVRWPYGSRAA